jgi:hypothetical protein
MKKKQHKHFKPFLEPNEVVLARNMVFDGKGRVKHLGYKTFKGMVSQLRKANRNLKKFGSKMQYQIILPIKGN